MSQNRKEQDAAEAARIAKMRRIVPGDMDFNDLEVVGDEVLQNVDPSKPKPTEEGEVAQWRQVHRATTLSDQ